MTTDTIPDGGKPGLDFHLKRPGEVPSNDALLAAVAALP
jgi:hypothetical protein